MLKSFCPFLLLKESETLSLLLDSDAIDTIQKSVKEAAAGDFEPLEEAVK